MKSIALISAVILSSLQSPALAQLHWKAIAQTPDGTYTYVDSGSMVREGPKAGFRVLEVSPQIGEDGSLLRTGWYQTDCKNRRIEIVSLKKYAADNTLIANHPKYWAIYPAYPGTTFEKIYQYGCKFPN